jgi:hypothetical protein
LQAAKPAGIRGFYLNFIGKFELFLPKNKILLSYIEGEKKENQTRDLI